MVFLWWCFSGGGWCFGGGVLVVFLWWCCGCIFKVVFWWYFCGGPSNIVQSSTEVMDVVKDCHQIFVVVFLWWCF